MRTGCSRTRRRSASRSQAPRTTTSTTSACSGGSRKPWAACLSREASPGASHRTSRVTSGFRFWIACSRDSAGMSGRRAAISTTCSRAVSASASAAVPLPVASTRYPRVDNRAFNRRRRGPFPSAISTVSAMSGSPLGAAPPARRFSTEENTRGWQPAQLPAGDRGFATPQRARRCGLGQGSVRKPAAGGRAAAGYPMVFLMMPISFSGSKGLRTNATASLIA